MVYEVVIRNGRVVRDGKVEETDLGISRGKIAAFGRGLAGDKMLDAGGKLVIPGGVDPHVHLEMPTPVAVSSDDWFTGTRAAACGGTTTVIDFVDPAPGESLLQALEKRRSQAAGRAVIDFGRVPLFFYLIHLWLYRLSFILLGNVLEPGTVSALAIWVIGLGLLWVLCVQYGRVKGKHPRSALQYI